MIMAQTGALPDSAGAPLDRSEAVELLVEEYGDTVLHLAYLHLKDRGLAEDVFQEVFTRVYLNWHKFRGDASPRTWIYRITVNLCRDKLRSPAIRRVVLLGEGVMDALSPAQPDEATDAILTAADRTVLLEVVTALPPEYREVVLLYYYESLEIREVAAALSLNEGTVRSRLHRARARLKAMLTEGGFDRE